MMISEAHRYNNLYSSHHAPPWQDQPTTPISVSIPASPTLSSPSNISSPMSPAAGYAATLASLRQYLLSGAGDGGSPEEIADDVDFPSGEFTDDDEFFMYDFKIRKCTRARAHDWTECPFAHPGEKARRRDPRKYSYSGTACTDFRKGHCKKGDGCEFAHGVFESWLHPGRYRTQACKDGPGCKRRVCFFAHRADQLRVNGSGLGSPGGSDPGSLTELAAALRNLQLNKVKSMPASSAWSVGIGSPVYGSPRGGSLATSRPGFFSLPTTPTTRPGVGYLDAWDRKEQEDELVMERVESGRELRARMFEKLSKENPLTSGPGSTEVPGSGPDLGWVSDLIQ